MFLRHFAGRRGGAMEAVSWGRSCAGPPRRARSGGGDRSWHRSSRNSPRSRR